MSKFLKNKVPEFYFLIITLLYWIDISNFFNPIAIVSSILLIYIIFKQNKIVALVYGTLILLLTSYLLLAFLSDLGKITTLDSKANKFIIYGSVLLIANFIMGFLMIYKNSTNHSVKKQEKIIVKR